MLIFKYMRPFYEKVQEYKWKDIKPVDALVTLESSNPLMEYNHLKRSIWISKLNTESIKNQYMREDLLPESLKPISIDGYPASFTECDLFCKLLKEYLNYIKVNEKVFFSNKIKMSNLLQTMIIIENKEVNIITDDRQLKEILQNEVKEYRKYNIKLIDIKEEKKNGN